MENAESTVTDYTYNNLNQLLSSSDGFSYAYDNAGNMTSVSQNEETVKEYSYDVFNRLSESTVNGTTANYTYNGDNLRQTKTANNVTTNHIYDGMNIVADLGNDTKVYFRGTELVTQKALGSSSPQQYILTPRGDVAKLVNTDGTHTDYEYNAFGEMLATTEETNPFAYCGEYTDAETGLAYLRNRYYDPSIGRFISEDTHWNHNNMIYGDDQKAVKYAIDGNEKIYCDKDGKIIKTESYNPINGSSDNSKSEQDNIQFYDIKRIPDVNSILQSSNLYVYVMNNPLRYIDPSGESITFTIGGATIVGAAIVKGIAYVAGAAAGIIMAADLGKKVGDVLKTRKGSIQNAPKPPGTPGWDAIRDLTMAEILRRAQKGETGFKTIWKLLNDGRFKK